MGNIGKVLKDHWGIFVVVIVAAFLYLYRLGEFPIGFYVDEAVNGYSAYSILLTGKDEWGKSWPIVFRGFGVFNPPLYIYLTAGAIKIFGVSIFAVRVASAIAGTVAVLGIYLLCMSFWPKKIGEALIAAIVLACCPWLVLYARMGQEINLAGVFFLLGMIGLYRGLKNHGWFVGAVIFLSASSYTAYTGRLLLPIFLIGFVIVFFGQINIKSKWFWIALGLFVFLHLPHLYLLSTPAFLPKAGDALKNTGLLAMIREFLAQYSNYLSPVSLFLRPDPDMQRSIPELATFYPWMLGPWVIGVKKLWDSRREQWAKFIWLAILVFPIPASLTHDPFASHRAYPLLFPMMVVIGLGLFEIKKVMDKRIFWMGFGVVILLSLVVLWRSYFVIMKERGRDWLVQYRELSKIMEQNPGKRFLIDQKRLKPAYANLAFELKYPPVEFQEKMDPKIWQNYYFEMESVTNFDLGRYETRPVDWEVDSLVDQIIVGDTLTISKDQMEEHFLTPIFEVKDALGEVLLVGYKTDPVKKCLSMEQKLRPVRCDSVL